MELEIVHEARESPLCGIDRATNLPHLAIPEFSIAPECLNKNIFRCCHSIGKDACKFYETSGDHGICTYRPET